jgi:hypothetical protein
VVLFLCQEGLLSIKDLYTDGTKIEANASRYSCVWGSSVQKNKKQITDQLNELWEYAQKVTAAEMDDDKDPEPFKKIDAQKVSETVAKINEALKGKDVSGEIKQKLEQANSWTREMEKCEQQEQVTGSERSSYSKTDPDATLMRMKEDESPTAKLKAGYNLQLSTNNQYIVCYSLHKKVADITTLIGHLDGYKQQYHELPEKLTADAGYGSQENYSWLEQKKIEAFVKHRDFERNQKPDETGDKSFSQDKLSYDSSADEFTCPAGQPMRYVTSRSEKTTTGFEQTIKHYQAQNCDGCALRPRLPSKRARGAPPCRPRFRRRSRLDAPRSRRSAGP